jgi:hypothetical protein
VDITSAARDPLAAYWVGDVKDEDGRLFRSKYKGRRCPRGDPTGDGSDDVR